MTGGAKATWLWLAFVVICFALAGLLLAAGACGGAKQLEAATACEGELTHAVLAAGSCNEAQFKVDAVIATNPACRGFAHFEVCALVKDGGSDGDH